MKRGKVHFVKGGGGCKERTRADDGQSDCS